MNARWWAQYRQLIGLAIALLATFLIFGFVQIWLGGSGFMNTRNIETILRQSTPVCIAALGMTLVIVSAGIDLSVGSVLALVSVVIAWCLRAGYGPGMAVSAGILAGCACGVLNGALVTKLKVGPFIVTLAAMLVARGTAKGLASETTISPPTTWINNLLAILGDSERWRIFPYGIWILVILAIFAHWLLRLTRFGRYVVAVGANERAARYSGINVDRVKFFVYVLMGLFAGFAGVMMYSRISMGDPTTAQGFELSVIAAVVIGGASLSGGVGTILGSLLGALIMATINAGCSQLGISNWIQEVITGGIIVVSVLLDRLRVGKLK